MYHWCTSRQPWCCHASLPSAKEDSCRLQLAQTEQRTIILPSRRHTYWDLHNVRRVASRLVSCSYTKSAACYNQVTICPYCKMGTISGAQKHLNSLHHEATSKSCQILPQTVQAVLKQWQVPLVPCYNNANYALDLPLNTVLLKSNIRDGLQSPISAIEMNTVSVLVNFKKLDKTHACDNAHGASYGSRKHTHMQTNW